MPFLSMSQPPRWLAIMALLGSAGVSANAQNSELTGVVLDPQGAAVAGARITVINESTQVHRTTVSTPAGDYDVPVLLPGHYTVRAEKDGFETVARTGIALYVATVTRADLHLVLGHKEEVVTVNGDNALNTMNDATVGQVIENKDIVSMPLNGRSYTQLAALAPGVSFSGGASQQTIIEQATIGTNGFYSASAARIDANYSSLNGIDVTTEYHGGTSAYPPIDGIQEFKLLESNYGAEYGYHLSQTIVETKAGGDHLHGSAYEFLRNNDLDAENFFATVASAPLKQNQFGASLGGPVILPKYNGTDRTFFFANYEGARLRVGGVSVTTQPTVLMRQGNFQELSTSIIDPQTGQPFKDNTIPPGRINQIALNILQQADYPLPNLPGLTNNYELAPVTATNQDEVLGRIDHTVTENDRLWGSLFWEHLPVFSPRFTAISTQLTDTPAQVYTLGETHILTPTVVNEARAGWTYVRENISNPWPGDLTMQAAGFPQNGNQPVASLGIPGFSIGSYGTAGVAWGSPYWYRGEHFQANDTVNWTKNGHAFKFGFDFLREHQDAQNAADIRGQYTFNGQYSSDAFADFLLGLPSSAERSVSSSGQSAVQYLLRANHFAGFAQDDWRVTRKIALNLGIRYENNTPPVEAQNRIANFVAGAVDGAPGIVRVDTTSQYGRCLCIPNHGDLEPRLGVAYSATNKTTLRAGYGLYFDFTPPNNQAGLPYALPWYANQIVTNTYPAPSFDLTNSFLPSLVATASGTFAMALNTKDARAQQWTVGVEQELGHSFVLELTYLGSATINLDARQFLNAALPGTGSYASRRPYPAYSDYTVFTWNASADYQAGTVQLRRQFANGLTLISHYTWGRSMDDTSGEADSTLQDAAYDLRSNWAVSDFNIKDRFVASAVYELPVGRGKALLNSLKGPADVLLSGWQFAPIYSIQSGIPFTVTAASNTANIETGILWPNRIASTSVSHRSYHEWFNTAAFAQPAAYEYGDAGRNDVVGPGYKDLDLALLKETQLAERVHMQLRGEFFNAFNNVNFGQPNASFGLPGFGTISGAGASRVIQFGLKLLF